MVCARAQQRPESVCPLNVIGIFLKTGEKEVFPPPRAGERPQLYSHWLVDTFCMKAPLVCPLAENGRGVKQGLFYVRPVCGTDSAAFIRV